MASCWPSSQSPRSSRSPCCPAGSRTRSTLSPVCSSRSLHLKCRRGPRQGPSRCRNGRCSHERGWVILVERPPALNRIAPNPSGSEVGVDVAAPARPAPSPEPAEPESPGPLARLRSLPAALPAGIGVVVVPVSCGAAAVLAVALSRGVDVLWGAPLALVVAAVLAEALPVPIEGVAAGATSFSDVFIAAAAVLYGWRVGAMVGALTMLLVELYTRRPLLRLMYNSSLYVLAGAAAGVVGDAVPDRYRTGLVSSLAFYAVDIALLCAVVARTRNEPYHRVARGFYASTSLPFVVNA